MGFDPADSKRAYLLSSVDESGATFEVVASTSCQVAFSGTVGADLGTWSTTLTHVYPIDFDALASTGTYVISVSGPAAAVSPSFQVSPSAQLYNPLLANALVFYQAQRDGPDVVASVLDRQPSHLTDEQATTYSTPTYRNDVLTSSLAAIGGPVDVSGGWFDAGDYLKFVETTSYAVAVMFMGVRDHPQLLTSAGVADFKSEAEFGIRWLLKVWNDSSQTLQYQVGIGDGNSRILGDHDVWRLPQADDAMQVKDGGSAYFIKYRPVFVAGDAGAPVSPNLAGRLAADFGLCAQVEAASDPTLAQSCLSAGEHVLALANTAPRALLTAAPYDYYPETSWRDDLELGATEMSLALLQVSPAAGLPVADAGSYLAQGASWAKAYSTSGEAGTDSLNLYDVSALAHAELYRALQAAGASSGLAVTSADLLDGMASQLQAGVTQAAMDPFGLGFGYNQGDVTPHALGLSVTASIYESLSGDASFHTFGLHQRDFIFGANAWGSAFVVGDGPVFPDCLQHQVANLVGSLTGASPLLLGAVVDGPQDPNEFSGLGLPSGARNCPVGGGDAFKRFGNAAARYQDNAVAWPSTEPSLDYTALTILMLSGG